MSFVFSERLRTAFAPPRYLAPALCGIDVSTSGVKVVRLAQSASGLVLGAFAQERLPLGVYTDGEIVDREAIISAITTATKAADISGANVGLSELKSYLFETSAAGATREEWRTAVEQHLDELIPLPPSETAYDIVGVGQSKNGDELIAGVGFARRVVDDTLSVFDEADITVRALEGEPFAIVRALLPAEDMSTVLVVDVGKTKTKVTVVASKIPRFAATIHIGGHALTLAVQKYFGVTEEEARAVKAERGILPAPGNEEYLAAMLSTVSAIRDEISSRLEYWQDKETLSGAHAPVSRVILVGGNASVRGLPEYLEGTLKIPVATGNVFSNLAPRDSAHPSLGYTESLAYATAIGLALRDAVPSHA